MIGRAAKLSVLTCTVLGAGPLHAAERRCGPLIVEAEGDVASQFPDLTERVQLAFEGRADVDPCSRIGLAMKQSAISVSVQLPDGREAFRSVSRPEDVVPTLQALLLIPETPAPPSQPEVGLEPAAPPAERKLVPPDQPPQHDSPTGSSASAARLGVELSAALAGRAGDGQTGIGLGLQSFVDIRSWLVGFQARADHYQASGQEVSTEAIELALLAGKRFDLESVALDLVAGPALSLDGGTERVEINRPDRVDTATTERGVEPRVLVASRLSSNPRGTFRAFVGLDADFVLGRNTDGPVGVVELPAWTFGLSLGSTVGTP